MNTAYPAAEEARAADVDVIVVAEEVEQFAENQRDQQKNETDRGNAEENQERGQRGQVHTQRVSWSGSEPTLGNAPRKVNSGAGRLFLM